MASSAVLIQDGAGVAATTQLTVTPGNTCTLTLNSTTSVQTWNVAITSATLPSIHGLVFGPNVAGSSYSFSVPTSPGTFNIYSSVYDGYNTVTSQVTVTVVTPALMLTHRATNVITANVADLTAFTVASAALTDTTLNVQGDIVLLATQTTSAQNGLYQVGVVTTGTAPLTRVGDLPTGAVVYGCICEVNKGAIFANTTWKITTSGAVTIGTTSHNWYPRSVIGSTALSSGTFTISVPVLSATKSTVSLARTAIGGTLTGNVSYSPTTSAGATGFTAGIFGTGAIVVTSQGVAGAATLTGDTSTLNWVVTNW